MRDMAKWLTDPKTWEAASEAIGMHPHYYDLSDASHRLDAVQIVCEALALVLPQSEET
jgi:hypothetical protein